MKQTVELDIPDGYEFVRFGIPDTGEAYIFCDDTVRKALNPFGVTCRVIVRPAPKWRTARPSDLESGQPVPCRFRNPISISRWTSGCLVGYAVAGYKFFCSCENSELAHWYPHCEVNEADILSTPPS